MTEVIDLKSLLLAYPLFISETHEIIIKSPDLKCVWIDTAYRMEGTDKLHKPAEINYRTLANQCVPLSLLHIMKLDHRYRKKKLA